MVFCGVLEVQGVISRCLDGILRGVEGVISGCLGCLKGSEGGDIRTGWYFAGGV